MDQHDRIIVASDRSLIGELVTNTALSKLWESVKQVECIMECSEYFTLIRHIPWVRFGYFIPLTAD
ncbi:hypothetical protein [Paenibacillus sp. Soil522]|uniref:hypothetical protein n=1 Tax=Paenibacillus sp. Soil522 TaxID=1736388 RepID=UPI0006FFE979|nr:hypothetical protein [Paenibacillus sp. Soil522]KRE41819.1 hypothetical protein ASG81_16245 [Paenibacillus sp. Soil522]